MTDQDSQFARAIRLLHSKSKDSEEQLRGMLDDAIKQRHGSSKTLANTVLKKESTTKRETPKTATASGPTDDFSKDSENTFEEVEETSKSFMTKSEPPSPSPQDDDDELALEILEEDLTCVVCRGMDVVARNQLVECFECHSLYHQECHEPPVEDADMNDPRSAWYCANCPKPITKVQGSAKQASASGAQPTFGSAAAAASSGKSSFSSSTSKSARHASPTFIAPSKSTSNAPATITSSSKSYGGLPPPPPPPKAASGTAKQSTHSSSSQKVVVPNINIISADKRLQIMKKKAAKMQEKRKHSK